MRSPGSMRNPFTSAAALAAMFALVGGEAAAAVPPASFDWRDFEGTNYVSAVRSQGNCGSVYIFAPVAMVESRQMIAAGRRGDPVTALDYSEQYILSCGSGAHGAFGCNGGYANEVLLYLRDVGVPWESCYLNDGVDAACPGGCPDSGAPLLLFTPVTSATYATYPGDAALMQEIYDHGPVAVTMEVYSDFQIYDGGIYRHVTGGSNLGLTLVTVVGWGNDAGTDYWIAKNSWDTWWGEDGYIRIDRSSRGGCNFAAYIYTCEVERPPVSATDTPALSISLLGQNWPNPFNPRTTIRYDLPEAGLVLLSVFDLAGQLVRTLVDENRSQGSHEAVWDGRDATGKQVSSGAYLARLSFNGRAETVRMGLLR